MILKSYLADMDDPREKNLRLAIKEMALTSSRKVLREEAILSPVHVLHERPGLTGLFQGFDRDHLSPALH